MRIVFALGLSLLAGSAAAQARLVAAPARPEPGALVRLTLRDTSSADTIVAITGAMSGEPLHFRRAAAGVWHAIGPVGVGAVGHVGVRAVVTRASRRADTVMTSVSIPVVKTATARLDVDSTFSKPPDPATTARIARENARARAVGRASHDTPQQWMLPFKRPRMSVVTGNFGTGRLFNGAVTSRHLGVDLRGAVGDTIRAANRGIVALVDGFFLAGNVVYIDHGAGVVTGYFHMSRQLVAEGDTVSRGQPIGLVGQTGRVTAPHLHWSARYGTHTVNPLDLLEIP